MSVETWLNSGSVAQLANVCSSLRQGMSCGENPAGMHAKAYLVAPDVRRLENLYQVLKLVLVYQAVQDSD